MKKAPLLLRWYITIFIATIVGTAFAQPVAISEFANATGDNVVRIESSWGQGASTSGFGYIVGTAERRMTVATARHVLATMVNGEFQVAKKIEIITRKGERHVGENVGLVNVNDPNGIDLGFIEFTSNASVLFTSPVVALMHPAAGEEVWLQGAKGEVKLTPTAGRVSAMTATLVRVSALGGVAGVSGAPVLSSRGVVGLYLGGDPTANVLQIGVIQRYATSLRRTWTLTPTPGSLPTITVQFSRTDFLDIPVSVPVGASVLKVPGIYELAPGSYGLNFDFKRLECVPKGFAIAVGNSKQTVEIFCSPRLEGKWSSSEADALVTPIGNGDYELITLAKNNLPSNSLRGRLIQTNSANHFQTAVTDLLGRERSGSMEISPDLLEMKITIPVGAFESRTLTLRR